MSERLKFEGRLGIKEKEARRLRIGIESDRDSLRDALDPTVQIEELEEERISNLAVILSAQLIEYSRLIAEIQAIKKALGKG